MLRRSFLAASAASAASAARVIGANDRIAVGFIGVGGKGFGHVRELLAQSRQTGDVQLAAACDVYSRYRDRARDAGGIDAAAVCRDHRDLLARPGLDAVFIATPDHWHARHALDAMAAGKDVYLQKPMTLTIGEAQAVSETANRLGRVLQIGSQHLSDPRHHEARRVIEQGEIGNLLWAQGTYSRNSSAGEWNYYIDEEASPATIDWDRWLGPAPKRPFSAERFFRWRKYWDYSGGIATDLFYHKLGPLLYALGPQFPTRVTGSGGIYVQKDREVPDTYATIVEYRNFYVNLSSSMANAAANRQFPETIYGHKGTITFTETGIVVTPESKDAVQGKAYEVKRVNVSRAHTDDFFRCMRTRRKPVLDGDLGYQIMTAIKLGVESYREGKVRFWGDAPSARPAYEGDGRNYPGEYRKRS